MPDPQLSFALDNPSATNTVYASPDPNDNHLTLVITTNVAASLAPGTMVAPEQAGPGTGSLLYLDLTSLGLKGPELGALSIGTTGWSSQVYAADNMLGFTPASAVSLDPSTPLSLSVDGFAMAQSPGPTAQLDVVYFRVTPITPGNTPYQGNFVVAIQPPPDTGKQDLHNAITVTVTPSSVVNSIAGYPQVDNDLMLVLSPGEISASAASSGTQFVLTFAYANGAPGFGALVMPSQVQPPFAVTAGPTTGAQWKITPDLDQQSPSWQLVPPASAPIVPAGGTVAFNITNLVTTFAPGPTLILVSAAGVPGFNDALYSIPIEKIGHVAIEKLSVTPKVSVLRRKKAEVTVSWTTSYATQLTLQPVGADVTHQTDFNATIYDTTPFRLVAEGDRPGNVDNTASLGVTAKVLPVINSFTATPEAAYQGDLPSEVALAWNVDTNNKVTLSSSVTGTDGNLYDAAGGVDKQLAVPQLLTLTPTDAQGKPSGVSRSLLFSAFEPSAKVIGNGLLIGCLAAPPKQPFVAASVVDSNQVAILSTATFQSVMTLTVGSQPVGIAFSPDGSTMFVADSGDGTVSVVGVSPYAGSPPFQFQNLATVQVGGTPLYVAVGADGSAWVTVNRGTGNGSVVKIAKVGNQYTATAIPVGVSPEGVAITKSNALVFVANQDSDSVSVVANLATGPVATTSISGLNQPFGLAVSPDDAALWITCGDGTVVGVNVQSYPTSPRKTYSLSGTPKFISMFSGGTYAALTCTGPDAVTLLNYQSGTTVTTTLTSGPMGVAVTPDDGMVVVGLPDQSGAEVVSLARYAAVPQPVACGGSVTNVAFTPDGTRAIAWSNALVTIQGTSPLLGLCVYATATGTASTALAGQTVVDVAVSPVASDGALYLANFDVSSVSVYSTTSIDQPLATIPIPAKDGHGNRHPWCLAISSDGRTLFVLTSDGGNAFSVVVFQVDPTTKTFTQLADVSAFQTASAPLTLLLMAAPDGSAAYAVDTVGSQVYAVKQAGSTFTLGPSPLALPEYSTPVASAILPDGSMGYVLVQFPDSTSAICKIDLMAWTVEPVYLPDGMGNVNITGLAVSPDGQLILAADSLHAGIRILDAESLRINQTMSWPSGVSQTFGVAVSADGSRICTANAGSGNIAVAEQVQPAPAAR